MGIVRYVFLNEQQALTALEQLRREFADERITMTRIMPSRSAQEYIGDHDPIGGWRFTGTSIMTLPATGPTLVGNSTTVDVSIGDLDELLETTAARELATQRDHRTKVRILADIEVHSAEEAQLAVHIMDRSGGYALDTPDG
ncbi:MAG: hypothetical protein ACOYEP_05625 [Limnochordia bacterium]